jgi:hypothetical protein
MPINSSKLKDLINTFIIKSIFKYNSYYFYRVIINTRAFKYSITRYK